MESEATAAAARLAGSRRENAGEGGRMPEVGDAATDRAERQQQR